MPVPRFKRGKGLRQPYPHDLNVIFSHRYFHIKSVSGNSGYRELMSFFSAMHCFGSEYDPLSVSINQFQSIYSANCATTTAVQQQKWMSTKQCKAQWRATRKANRSSQLVAQISFGFVFGRKWNFYCRSISILPAAYKPGETGQLQTRA